MNIKNKALLIVTGVVLALSGFYLLQGIAQHNEEIDAAIQAEEASIDATVADIERYSYAMYRARLGNLVEEHPELVRAFAERDRERLYELSLPLFKRRRAENPFLHAWDFSLPDGTVFLRVQDPAAFGDNLLQTREMIQAVHDRREPAAGFDVGRHGAIYWVARPVFHQGVYVGATELGLQAEQLTEALGSRFKSQVALTVKPAEWQKATLVGKGYRPFGDRVLIAPEDSRFQRIPDEVLLAGTRDQRISLDGGDYILHNCSILPDYRGRAVGSVLVLQDITESTAHKRKFVLGATLATGLLLSVTFAVLYASFGTLIGRLQDYAAESNRAREEIEKSRNELDLRVRERTGELEQANRSLEEQRQFLQTVLESLTHPFYVIDAANYRILLANKAAHAAPETAVPLTCYAMTHQRTEPCTGKEHPCALRELKLKKKPLVLEHVHRTNGGQPRTFQIYAYPILDSAGEVAQVIEYCIDITAGKEADRMRDNLERQLRQAQKMEAIGTLAGGIAHDFNNILSAIYGHAEMIRYDAEKDPATREHVEEILRAGARAKDMVGQILAFSRQGERESKPLYLHPIVKEALKLLRASIPTTIDIRENIPACPPIIGDPIQIHQVIMNLCTNAYHAMREEGGTLAVSLAPVVVGEEDQKAELRLLAPGDYLKLAVTDTGCGMNAATLEKIFDPYFTTKKKGEGTGLGLAVVHGIVKSHHGHITVYSEPGAGTTFNVYFPQCAQPLRGQDLIGPEDVIPAAEALPGGKERILLVDDEEEIVKVGRAMLESLGYTVETFTDSLSALHAFTARPGDFDLVVTDMTMPDLTGEKLTRKMLELRPDQRIVLCTGFSEIIDGARARAIGIREFIMKPILKVELARIVRKALDGR